MHYLMYSHTIHSLSIPAHSTTLINVCIGCLPLISFKHFDSPSLGQFHNKLFTRLNWPIYHHILECFQLVCALYSTNCFTAFWNLYMYTVYANIHGANLVSSPHQRTPLHEAAGGGSPDTVEYIIQAGADINIKSDDGVSK